MWYSRQWDWSPMPHAIFFHRGTAIHGTYYVNGLGRPASHGCVRLAPSHAATLYQLVSNTGMQATRVRVHGKPPYGEEYVARRSSREGYRTQWSDDDDDYRPRAYRTRPTYVPYGRSQQDSWW
jgi:hypothetical protein